MKTFVILLTLCMLACTAQAQALLERVEAGGVRGPISVNLTEQTGNTLRWSFSAQDLKGGDKLLVEMNFKGAAAECDNTTLDVYRSLSANPVDLRKPERKVTTTQGVYTFAADGGADGNIYFALDTLEEYGIGELVLTIPAGIDTATATLQIDVYKTLK